MKKILNLIFLIVVGVTAMGQNPISADTAYFKKTVTDALVVDGTEINPSDTVPFKDTKYNVDGHARFAEVGGGDLIAMCLNYEPESGGGSLTSQQIQYGAFSIRKDTTITGCRVEVTAAGVYTATNYNGIGLYKLVGGVKTLVASSTNNGDLWKSTGLKSVNFSSSYEAEAGIYYVGVLWSGSGASPAPSVLRIFASYRDWYGIGDNFASHANQTGQTSLPATATFSIGTTVSVIFGIY